MLTLNPWKHETPAESSDFSRGFVPHAVPPQASPEARPHNWAVMTPARTSRPFETLLPDLVVLQGGNLAAMHSIA